MVLTCDNNNLRSKASQRQSYRVPSDERLPKKVEFALAKLILKELEHSGKSETQKYKLSQQDDYNLD